MIFSFVKNTYIVTSKF